MFLWFEFKQLVQGIRIIEQSLGKDKIYPKERSIRKWARRSLVSIKISKNKIMRMIYGLKDLVQAYHLT